MHREADNRASSLNPLKVHRLWLYLAFFEPYRALIERQVVALYVEAIDYRAFMELLSCAKS